VNGVLKTILVLLASVPLAFLGWALAKDPGRLSLHFWGWQVDTTLVLASVLLAILLGSWWLLMALMWRWPKHLLQKRQAHLAAQFQTGLIDYAQGQYARAKKRFLAATARSDQAGLSWLYASFSAGELGLLDDAKTYAAKARLHESSELAAQVWEQELSLKRGDLSGLETLQRLSDAGSPKAAVTLARALSERERGAESMQAWQRAQKLLPGSASSSDWATMARLSLRQAPTLEQLDTVWKDLSPQEQGQADVLSHYVAALFRLNGVESGFDALYSGLKQDATESLWLTAATFIDRFNAGQQQQLLKLANKQLGQHDDNQALHLAAAKLLRAQGQTAEADAQLQTAAKLGDSQLVAIELAESKLKAGDFHGAALAYQKAWQSA
jgi:uncharacterized protein HemY